MTSNNRQGFIGGTDVRILMTGTEEEIVQLWKLKTGRAEPEDLTDVLAVQLGIHTESFNLDWFNRHVEQLDRRDVNISLDMIMGKLDAVTVSGVPVECKHTNAFNSLDDIIETYYDQLQTYMHLAEKNRCWVSVIFGNSKWEAATVSFDDERWVKAEERIAYFWQCVTEDVPPHDLPDPEPVTAKSLAINDMVTRDATGDNEFGLHSDVFIETKQAHANHEKAKTALKKLVKPNEREVYTNRLSIKRDARGALRFTIKEQQDG